MGRLKDRLKKTCERCGAQVLARRIEGRYVNEKGTRILIWECVECGYLWQKTAKETLLSADGVE
jgi:ribosomal protein L37AE/L43A